MKGYRMDIIDLRPEHSDAIQQTADLLVVGFRDSAPQAWPDYASAFQEVQESFGPGRISRVALQPAHTVVGWIGGKAHYNGHVWEIHPLVVHPNQRGQGIGRALMQDFEDRVRERGGLTLWLGSDDEQGLTSLAGIDLYPNVWEHIATIQNLHHHPYTFYQKLGFVIVGVLPDANGAGKPDIFMAKRVAQE
jgi:aminoglycoside 6'-N-acetyltransferase I